MKHTREELKQLQSLPLETKIQMSKQRIREWYDAHEGGVYISFSGGKDSTVLKHLVEHTPGCEDVPSVFCDTGLEYPEVRRFALSQPNVTVIKPKMRFDEVIEKYGWPVISKHVANAVRYGSKQGSSRWKRLHGMLPALNNGKPSMFNMKRYAFLLNAPFKISDQCCDVMKKRPFYTFEKVRNWSGIIGTMAQESNLRTNSWLNYGCNAFDMKEPKSRPLAFWTDQDILLYLKTYDLPYASVYGEIVETENGLALTGVTRTGCMFCGFGCHLEKEPNRFQRMKETHPAQYKYCMDKLGLREVLDFISVPYE